VYALGAVLYEMLAGEAPFTGPTAQAIVAKVLTTEPGGIRSLRRTVPPHVEAVVMQALEKLPADRFGTAAEFAAALSNPSYAAPARAALAAPSRQRILTFVPWLLLALALGLLGWQRWGRAGAAEPEPIQRFSIVLPEDGAWTNQSGASLSISRNGRVLVYTGRGPGIQRIYLRPMDRTDPVPVPGTDNGGRPVFSPDGRWIGFVGNRGLVRVPVAGGPTEDVCRLGGYMWLAWLENNSVVFADGTGGLRQCSFAGEVTTLLANDSGATFNHPHGLPGDRGILFTLRQRGTDRIAVLDLRSRVMKPLDLLGSDPRYVETGHLVYVTPDGTALAVPFDLDRLTPSGDPVTIAQGIAIDGDGTASMAVSLSGVFVAVSGSASSRALELVDRTGQTQPLTTEVAEFYGPRFSPDGRRIAVSRGEITLWVLDRAQGNLTRLPPDGSALRPVWTPDGSRIAYVRQTGAKVDLRIVNADGSAPPESLLTHESLSVWAGMFTPDGRSLVVRTVGGPTLRDIWLKHLDSASALVPLVQSPANEVSPSLSPDGKWLAYNSNESGRLEIYVRAFPGMGGRTQVSIDGGTEPVWSPRGNELFYRSGEHFIAALVRTSPAFEVIQRTTLFSSRDYGDPDGTYQDYDVSPDARSFVMVRNLNTLTQFQVTLNLFRQLQTAAGEARR
jgi:serine/threonine-protein kinase